MSEFETISLKEFLLIKYLDRPFHLLGWRFEIDRYALQPGDDIPRGFWVDRSAEHRDGRIDVCLRWFILTRWPHSEKRKAAWAARFKAVDVA